MALTEHIFPIVHCVYWCVEEWHYDEYRWKQVSQIPKQNPQTMKMYYQSQQPTGLSKEFMQSVFKVYGYMHYT